MIMNHSFKLLAFALIVSTNAVAQATSALPGNIRAAYSLDRLGDGLMNEIMDGIPLPAPKVIGDTYIDQDWKKGAFLIYGKDKSLGGYEIRYDLDKQELEIKTQTGVKVVSEAQLKSFITFSPDEKEPRIFVNAREFKAGSGFRFIGFLRVLEDGDYALVSGFTIKVKRPDYNVAMNVGSRDYQIYKKEQLFYVTQGTVFALPGKKRELLSIFPEQAREEVSSFVQSEKLDPSETNDLMKIFRFYNNIVKK